ncbi:MAG: polysaccharide biosynthesis/export family protein [Rhodoferax sp.]
MTQTQDARAGALLARAAAALALLTGLLSGCSTAPGMFMATPATEQPHSTWFGPAASAPEPSIEYSLIRLGADNMASFGLPANAAAPAFNASQTGPYRLGLQDVLRINVFGHPDFLPTFSAVSSTGIASVPLGRTINEDGKLFFPLVGVLPAAGLSVPEFRAALTKALTRYIKDPQVDVDVAAFRSQRVFLAGEVKTPSAVPITDIALKITDAIAAAGGTTAEADLYTVQLTRGAQSFTIDLNRLYYGGDLALNLTLQHGDVLTVPDRQARKVFLLGELSTPKSLVLRRGRVTLAEVVTEAGGPNPLSSNAGEVFVMRLDPQGKPLVFQLDASQPIALLLADRFEVQSRDLVYVNPTRVTQVTRILNQYLPFLQTAANVKVLWNW